MEKKYENVQQKKKVKNLYKEYIIKRKSGSLSQNYKKENTRFIEGNKSTKNLH